MKTLALLAALAWPLLLAGCAAPPDLSTPLGQCRAQAENSPRVRELEIQTTGGSDFQQADARRQLPRARREAYTACLQSRGLAPKGGVEAVQ